MRKFTFCTLALLLLTISAIYAQRAMRPVGKDGVLPEAPYRTSWALLIGINKYPNLPVQYQLRYAVNDVKGLKQVLMEQYQFPESNIITLTNEQATYQNIKQKMAQLSDPSKVEHHDRVLIYFSGHGQTVPLPRSGEMGFIIPCDAKVDMSDIAASAYYAACLPMGELRRLARMIPAKHVLFLVDACYSGLAVSSRGGFQPSVPGYLRKVASLPVQQVITAGLKGDESYEKPEWGHGAFTYKLLEALRTGVADANEDGIITGLELAAHLRNVVPNISPKQTPQYGYFEGEGEFLFLRGVATVEVGVEEVPSLGTLGVSSVPVGATVYVDGVQRGVTPMVISEDTGVTGERTVIVALELEGYVTKRGKVTLQAGRKASWNVTLERLPEHSQRIDMPTRPGEEPSGPSSLPTRITGKDGVPMVLIPAGEFQMGSNDGRDSEKPVHTVYLDAFYMDVYEVTNAQYRKFTNATGHKAPKLKYYWNDSRINSPDQPVVGVSWHDAKAYCDWAGKRLPTEAEWEKAARGGLVGKKYPWGDNITHDDANYDDTYTDGEDRWEYSAPVGSFAPNGYGLYDMAGNVREWCADWFDYYSSSPGRNPTGPSSRTRRVLRGGSWVNQTDFLRVAYRFLYTPTGTEAGIGFRCVADVTP